MQLCSSCCIENCTEKLTGMQKITSLKIPEKDQTHMKVGRHYVHSDIIVALKLQVQCMRFCLNDMFVLCDHELTFFQNLSCQTQRAAYLHLQLISRCLWYTMQSYYLRVYSSTDQTNLLQFCLAFSLFYQRISSAFSYKKKQVKGNEAQYKNRKETYSQNQHIVQRID